MSDVKETNKRKNSDSDSEEPLKKKHKNKNDSKEDDKIATTDNDDDDIDIGLKPLPSDSENDKETTNVKEDIPPPVELPQFEKSWALILNTWLGAVYKCLVSTSNNNKKKKKKKGVSVKQYEASDSLFWKALRKKFKESAKSVNIEPFTIDVDDDEQGNVKIKIISKREIEIKRCR